MAIRDDVRLINPRDLIYKISKINNVKEIIHIWITRL